MGFHFSKSKFVSACVHCQKYAWLDKNKPEEKAGVSEFTESLFENGHKVGELAKEYFKADVDVTSYNEKGKPDLPKMLEETKRHLALKTKTIAEASFEYDGFFCSVDILRRNEDGSYNLYEVKSSKREKSTKTCPNGVKEKYIIDASYQRYVLENCGINVDQVHVVLLDSDYRLDGDFELDKYFIICNVTSQTDTKQTWVRETLKEIGDVLSKQKEPKSVIAGGCNGCDYFDYCGKSIHSPSPFELYNLKFSEKCELYNNGISFYDAPKVRAAMGKKVHPVELLQGKYYNLPDKAHVEKDKIREFLDGLSYPLYSLDFETYQAVVPEHQGMKTYEQVPFQYSLHTVKRPDPDISDNSEDVEEHHYLDLSGRDTRREIAESLVKNIPHGACVIAYNESTERNLVKKLALHCPDLADHLLSFEYKDPKKIFQAGFYYTKAMGKSFSLKSVAPALYPDDPGMDYHNLEGKVKNGTQAMNVYFKIKEYTEEEKTQIRKDLETYCALDTLAVVKILKKLYEVSK